jgi:hypothetical protein
MNKRLAQTVIEISLRERLRLALLVTLLGVLSAAGADDGESVEELLTAVVGVYATVPEQARTAAALGTERFGSGVVIDSSGLIVTIGYLILEAEKVEIVLPSEELVPVEVLAYDYETGFGLLRAPDRVKIAPMSLGSSSGLPTGEKLLIASYELRRRANRASGRFCRCAGICRLLGIPARGCDVHHTAVSPLRWGRADIVVRQTGRDRLAVSLRRLLRR